VYICAYFSQHILLVCMYVYVKVRMCKKYVQFSAVPWCETWNQHRLDRPYLCVNFRKNLCLFNFLTKNCVKRTKHLPFYGGRFCQKKTFCFVLLTWWFDHKKVFNLFNFWRLHRILFKWEVCKKCKCVKNIEI
jgi:hypothetical protein